MNQSPADRILEDLFLLGMSTQRTQDMFDTSVDNRKDTEVQQAKTQLRDALLEQVIDKEYEIFLTKDEVVHGELGEDVVRHWNQLRAEQRKALESFFGRSE